MKGDFCGVPHFLGVLCLALISAFTSSHTLHGDTPTAHPAGGATENKISQCLVFVEAQLG